MSKLFELTAKTREALGTGASRRLRRLENRVPAILYGASEPPLSISLDHNQLLHALENQSFYSHILTIQIDGKRQKAVLKDLQRHAYKPSILHVDLLRVTAEEKITLSVPLHFKGEENAPGVKKEGGVFARLLNSVEVRCLPDVLPEFIEVDISHMQLDETLHLSQLVLPTDVELTYPIHEDDLPIASIHILRTAVEEESSTATPEPAEVPAINVKDDKSEKKSSTEKKEK